MSTFEQAEQVLRAAADAYEDTNTPAGRRMAMFLRYCAGSTGDLEANPTAQANARRVWPPHLSDERLSTERDNIDRTYTVKLQGVWALPVSVSCAMDDRDIMLNPELATNEAIAQCFAMLGEHRDRLRRAEDARRLPRGAELWHRLNDPRAIRTPNP